MKDKPPLTMAQLIVVVIVFLGVVSAASAPVSVHYGEDATFSWPLPASAQGKLVRVVNPYGAPVLDWGPGCAVAPSSVYSNRVRSSCEDASQVTFTLLGAVWQDEGPYTCRDVTSSDLQIDDCGQNLTLVKVSPQLHINLNTSDTSAGKTEGKYLILTCVVTKAYPKVPEDGYSWSYLPSSLGQLRPLVGKTRILTLGPLTRGDRGQYFCQARNDQNNRWNIRPGMASIALNESCIVALLRSDVSSNAVVEKDGDRCKAMFELVQHPKLILVQHPNTYIITDWHPPCNFSVSDAFKDRVTNTSCDPCKRTLSFSLVNVTSWDLGWYQCYAGTTFGDKLDSCSVELISKVPIQVHIRPITPDNVVKGIEGNPLTLTCVVTQALPPVPEDGYSWSYLPSSLGQLRPLVEKTHTLTLGPLARNDSGQYFCQAWNDLTKGGKIRPEVATVTVDVSYLGQIKSTPEHKVNEGDLVTLTCSVDSKPAARLAWVVEGQEVRHVTGNEDHYVVERAACSDSKTYTCHASNPDLPGLERTASTTLTVNCAQDFKRKMTTSQEFTTSAPAEKSSKAVQESDKLDEKAQMSDELERWLIALVVLVALVVIMVAVVIGLHIYCSRHQERKYVKVVKNDGNDLTIDLHELKDPLQRPQDCNSD